MGLRLPEVVYQDGLRSRASAATADWCLRRGHLSLGGWNEVRRDLATATPADARALLRRFDELRAARPKNAPHGRTKM